MRVAQLGFTEYFTDGENGSLDLVYMTWFVSFDGQGGADHMGGGRDVEQ